MPSGVVIGALIGVVFALGWAYCGLQGLAERWRLSAFGISLTVSVFIAGALLRRFHSAGSPLTPGSFDGAIYGWAVALESLAIVSVTIVLRRLGLVEYVMPTVALMVGAHFFGLARAMTDGGGRVFIWVGTLMCLSAVGIVVALARSYLSSAQSMVLTGFSCALILWASAISTLFPAAGKM